MNEISAAGPDNSIRPIRPFILCVLDGWGERGDGAANAIAMARKPTWDKLMARCPHARLQASADEVGDRGFARQINDGYVFRLVVFERLLDEVTQVLHSKIGR